MASVRRKVKTEYWLNGRRVPAGTPDAEKRTVESKKWYIFPGRNKPPIPGYTDKKATEQLAARLERNAARSAEGLTDQYEPHRKRPLAEHLADFGQALRAKNNTEEYVRLVLSRLEALLTG